MIEGVTDGLAVILGVTDGEISTSGEGVGDGVIVGVTDGEASGSPSAIAFTGSMYDGEGVGVTSGIIRISLFLLSRSLFLLPLYDRSL